MAVHCFLDASCCVRKSMPNGGQPTLGRGDSQYVYPIFVGCAMTEDEWKAHARHVVKEMQGFTAPFVSPISYEKPGDVPRLSGTGSFIELFGRKFLLTNEHVILDLGKSVEMPNLAHGLPGTDNVVPGPCPLEK